MCRYVVDTHTHTGDGIHKNCIMDLIYFYDHTCISTFMCSNFILLAMWCEEEKEGVSLQTPKYHTDIPSLSGMGVHGGDNCISVHMLFRTPSALPRHEEKMVVHCFWFCARTIYKAE